MIPILDGAYNPDPRLRPKVWNRPPSWPMPPNGTVGISLAADDENTQQDLFFWTDPRLFAVNRKGPTAMGSLVYDMAGGGFIDTTRGARLQSALWVVKEPYGGANTLALNIHDTGCGDAKGGLVIELPYDAGTVTSDTRILAELSHHRGGFIVSGCPNDWHNRGQDADGRPINGAHISLHTNLYHKPTIDGPMLWEGPWLPGEDGDKVTLVHFSWDAAIRHYRWYSWKDTYTPDVPSPPTWGGGNPGGGGTGGGGTTAGGNFVGDDPFGPIPVPGSPPPPIYPYSLNPELFQGLSPFPFNPNDPPVRPAQPSGPVHEDEHHIMPAEAFTGRKPVLSDEERGREIKYAESLVPNNTDTILDEPDYHDIANHRLHEWRRDEVNRPFTASSKEFASSAFLGRPQLAALNVPDFRNWNRPSPRLAQRMDNVTPVVATLAAYGEQVGSQWVYNQRPRHSRYLGGTAQGGFVMLPPEVGIDSFGDSFQPANIGTLSKPYFTMGPGARLGFGAPDIADGTVDNGWSMSWFLNSEINLDAGLLLRGNDFTLWRHASTPTPAFAILHSGANQGDIAWRSNTDFWGVFAHANTANRVYTFPDATGTVALVGSGTLTAGRVVYVDSSGQLTTDAGLLYNDSTDTLTAAILNLTAATSMIVFDSDAANTGTLTMGTLSTSRTWTLPNTTGTIPVGTGSPGLVTLWSAANAVTSDAGLAYDSTNDKLTILNSSTNVTPMLEVEQSSTGDTGARFTLTGGNSFMLGIDNSDSDKFKVSYGSAGNAALGTNDYLTIGTDGEVIAPQWLQIGTATDATAQGDFAAGLTSSHRLFYDQSAATFQCIAVSSNTFWEVACDAAAAFTPGVAIRRRDATSGATPDSANLGAIIWSGLTTGPAYYEGARIEAFNGANSATGYPTRIDISTNAGGGAGLALSLRCRTDSSVLVNNNLEVGTATDAATQGDFVCGLTGAARMFYDQSIPAQYLYNSAGAISVQLSQVASTNTVFNEAAADIDFRVEGASLDGMIIVQADSSSENIAFLSNGYPAFQSMDRGIFIGDASTVPTGNPTGGGFMYSESGAGKWRGTGGTITTFGPAEPHCQTCGRDFIHEWENEATGYLAVCMWCLTEELGDRPWIIKRSA